MTMTIDSIEDLEAQPEARANKPAPTPEPFRHKEAPQIRAAIDVAKESNLTADTVNRAIATGRSLGLPMRVVANSLELAQREELARRIESNPMLADWVGKDEYRAAVAAGDTEKIVNLFDGLQTEYQHRQAQRNDLNGFQKFGLLLEEGVQDVANSLEAGITGAVRALGKTEFTDDDGNRSAPFAEATANWADVMDSQRDANVLAQPPRLEAATTLGGYLQDVVRMVPQIGSQIAATLATGGAGGLAFMGNQIAGSTYDKLRRDGVDTNRAFIAGLGNAVLQAPLEQIGLGRIMKIFKATGAKTILKRTAQGAATEGFTEFLQAYPESATEIWAKLGENEGAKEWFERFKAALPETTRQGLYEGLVAAPFGILGGVGRALHENAWHKYVRNFQQRQIDFHDRVDDLRGCGMDNEIIQGMLEHGGMGTELGVSAQGLVELYQTGRDLITPLGLNFEDVLTAAETGQDVTMSLSRMHASLDKENFAALAPHIRPSLYGPTAVEAAENPVNMADVQRVAELYQDNRNLFAELDAEKARLKEELRKEIANSPNMQVQVEGFGGFDKFADDWLSLVERYAMRMGTSQNPIETMRRITLDEIRARASGAQPHGAEPAVAPEIAATKRIAPETRNEETEVQEPAREADDFSEWLAAQESLVNPFEDAETQQTAQPETAPMPENAPAAETANETSERKAPEPIAWDLMLDENYLSENALMDLDMTRYAADTAFLSTNKNELPVLAPGMSYKNYREGLARWRKKYPNSPGLKEVEEHLDWIESVAKAEGQELYQDGNPIEISSSELGVPENADIKDFISAAKKYHDQIKYEAEHGKPVIQPQLGKPVRFSGKGWKKNVFVGADPVKWMLFPKLRKIIENSKLIETENLNKARKDNFIRFHKLESTIILDGEQLLKVRIVLAEDINGNLFYNIFRDEENKSSSQLETRQQSRGHEELSQDGIPSGENNNQDSDNVNLDILESSDKTSAKRGSVQIYPESYLISLFEKADLSTLLHETGHIFFEEMERLVRAGAADASVMADYQVMRDWLGAREGEPLAIEQREQVARGFEAYLMEGRAPAPELQSAFRRFKKWLLRIYQSAVGLRVELNDDVRAVFSRMISTEQEINRAASENELLELTAKEISELGLTDNEAAQINAASANAREQAAEALQNARDANRIERRAKYAREAAAELAENQTYIARRDLRKTPLDIDAIRDGFGENLAAALRKKLPATTKKDGADPEIFAAEHGYKSADEMFTDILNSQTKGNAIREIVDRKEAESDAKFSAMEALLDTQGISTQMDLVGRKLADLVGAQQIERQAYTIAAQQELARMPVGKATQTSRYMAAMRRNILGYRHALFAGDREKALDYNRKALLNYEFAVQAQRLAKKAEKLQDRARDFVKSKTAGADARYFVADIAARHGLMRENEKLERGRNQGTIVDWVNSLKAEGVDLFLDDEIALGQGKYWRGMTVTEYDNLVDTLDQIITAERNQRKLLTARNKADLDAAADEIAASIFAHNDQHAIRTIQTPPKVVEACKRLHAIHTKVEALCLAVDGDKMGPTWEYIYRPINEAENNQNMRLGKVRDELKKIFSAYTGRELGRMGSRKEFEPAIGEKISYENRLCVALNMGNRDNINRLHEGHNWTDNQIAAIVAPLTAKDWNFVQQVWDYLDTFKKESFDLQQDVTGIRPKAVEAQPFQVTSSDGVVMDMKGGYYPIRYNPRKGEKAFQQNQQQMDQQLFGGRNYGSAQTRQGHLQQRSAGGLGTPLLLELSVTTDHVFNTVHDLAYRRAVLDVAKVIRHPTVVDAFERTVGRELYHQLKPWLQDVANEQQAPMGSVEGWARWARTSSSIMQMGYKVTSMLAQPMGITQTMELIGYKWTVIGLKEVYKNPMRLPDFVKETFARSSFMAGRLQSFDRDVRDITKSLNRGGYFSWVQTLRDKAFLPMGFMQMGVDLPSWWGAYSKGLQDFGGDETKAAEYADSIVRQAQGSGSTKDLARVQRGSELARLFTLFYSYFNTFYNLGARSIRALRQDHSPAGIYRAANSALLLWFLPCILTELVAGRGPGDDEDKAKWAASLLIQYPFQAVVGLRDLASSIFGKYDYQLTAAQSAPKSFVTWANSIQKAVEKDDYSKLAKPTAEAVGYAFGLPLKQPIITVGNMWNWMIGEDPDFAVRDLFLVKQKK